MSGSRRKISISIAVATLLVAGMMWACQRPAAASGLDDLLGAVGNTVDQNDQSDPSLLDSLSDAPAAVLAPVVESVAPVVETVELPVVDDAPASSEPEPVAAPVSDILAPVVEPVVDTVVAPVVDNVAPITEPVTEAVLPVVESVTDVVDTVAAPVTQTVDQIVEPVIESVAPVVDSVQQIVPIAPVVETVVEPIAAAPISEIVDDELLAQPIVDTQVLDELTTLTEPLPIETLVQEPVLADLPIVSAPDDQDAPLPTIEDVVTSLPIVDLDSLPTSDPNDEVAPITQNPIVVDTLATVTETIGGLQIRPARSSSRSIFQPKSLRRCWSRSNRSWSRSVRSSIPSPNRSPSFWSRSLR